MSLLAGEDRQQGGGSDMQHGHGHVAWTRTCNKNMNMEQGNRHDSWTRTCSIDWTRNIDRTWIWTCRMEIDMQHRQGHGHAAWE